jgi:hypothetical protein
MLPSIQKSDAGGCLAGAGRAAQRDGDQYFLSDGWIVADSAVA